MPNPKVDPAHRMLIPWIQHYKLYFEGKLVWEGEDLTQAPTPSLPLPWSDMKDHGGKRLESFWRLTGTENWVTWPGQPVWIIESAKKKKGIK